MNAEYIQDLVEDLYNVKDKAHKEFKEPIQIVIDLLDDLMVSGSIYLEEEE